MQRNRFLPDILTTLFDRKGGTRSDDDPRDIAQLCYALLSEEGEVSGLKLAETILTRSTSPRAPPRTLYLCVWICWV